MLNGGAETPPWCRGSFHCHYTRSFCSWIVDFIFILQNPLRNTASNRRFYHLYVWLMATATTGAVIGQNAKDEPDETQCLLRADSTNELVFVIPLLIYVSLGMISLVYAFFRLRTGTEATRLSRKRLFTRHATYVIAFMFLWLWPILHHYCEFYHVFSNDGVFLLVYSSHLSFYSGVVMQTTLGTRSPNF
jgi:hypothetical protein